MSGESSSRPPLALALALLLALAPAALAQQTPPPGEVTTFPAATELVRVDVLVLDGEGKPVEGLTAGDFTLEEDGRSQTLSSFEAVSLRESAPSARVRSRVSTNDPAVPRPERLFVIVFDEVNLSPTTVGAARNAVKEFLVSGLADGDMVTIVPSGGGAWWTERLPEGREALLARIDRLESKFRPDTSVARLSDFEALQIYYARDAQILSQVLRRYYENGVLQDWQGSQGTTAALGLSPGEQLVKARATEVYQAYTERVKRTLGIFERVAAALGQARGRKSVLFVSEGFAHDGTQPGFREVVRAARNGNAAFYFVDARGLLGAAGAPGAPGAGADQGRLVLEQDTLSTLANPRRDSEGAESVAADTGGYSIRNTDNLAEGMRHIAQESRAYYLLGYTPTNARRDGRFRKIEVRVGRAGLTTRARRGYYAPSDKDHPAPRRDGLDPGVRAALDAPLAVAGIPLRLVAHGLGPLAPGKSAALLVAEVDLQAVELRPGPDQVRKGALETFAVVSSRETGASHPQEKLVELALPPEAYSQIRASGLPIFREYQLPPGEYQARFVVRDRQSGRVGSVRQDFQVPDPETFGTSTPILTDRLLPAGPQGPGRPIPVAHRTFKSGPRLYYAYEVLGAARDPGGRARVSSSYVVRRADGSELVRTPPQPLTASLPGQVSQMLSVPLKDVPAGSYELLLTVRDEVAGRSVEVTDPFAVEG